MKQTFGRLPFPAPKNTSSCTVCATNMRTRPCTQRSTARDTLPRRRIDRTRRALRDCQCVLASDIARPAEPARVSRVIACVCVCVCSSHWCTCSFVVCQASQSANAYSQLVESVCWCIYRLHMAQPCAGQHVIIIVSSSLSSSSTT